MSHWTLTVRGYGPHESTTVRLHATGTTRIIGPSRAGKSLLMAAVCELLAERDPDGSVLDGAVRDCHDRRETTLTTPLDAVLRRTVTSKGSVSRYLTAPGGDETRVGTAAEWAQRLGPLAHPDLPAIMMPLGWTAGSLGDANGRALAEMLRRILPPVDLRAEVAELCDLRDTDPHDEAGAVAARREANKRRDEAAGRLAGARERLAACDAETPEEIPATALGSAQGTVAAATAWQEYDRACERAAERLAHRDRAIAAAESWDARRAEIGEAPTAEEIDAAEARARDTQAAATIAAQALSAAEARLRKAIADVEAYETGVDAHATAARALAEWQRKRDAIPAGPTDEEVDAAYRACGDARSAYEDAAATLREVETRLAAIPDGDECPTCGQTWAEAAAKRSGLADEQAAVAAARAHMAACESAMSEADAALSAVLSRRDDHEAAVRDLGPAPVVPDEPTAPTHDLDALRAEMQTATAADREAESAHDAAHDALAAIRSRAAEHVAAIRAIGDRPEIPDDAIAPTAPSGTRPPAQSVVDAQALIARAERARGAAERAAQERAAAQAAVDRETQAHAAAEAEAARLDRLVTACRRAPAIAAERQAAALGDLGPVSLRWGAGTAADPAVRVLCNGRPLTGRLVSDGERAAADLVFRAALRRALATRTNMERLVGIPLWVDRAQDLAGADWPDVPGPIVYLVTAAGPLRVEHA